MFNVCERPKKEGLNEAIQLANRSQNIYELIFYNRYFPDIALLLTYDGMLCRHAFSIPVAIHLLVGQVENHLPDLVKKLNIVSKILLFFEKRSRLCFASWQFPGSIIRQTKNDWWNCKDCHGLGWKRKLSVEEEAMKMSQRAQRGKPTIGYFFRNCITDIDEFMSSRCVSCNHKNWRKNIGTEPSHKTVR